MKEKLKKISISSVFKILLFAIAGILFFENILFAYNNLQNRYPILGLRLNGQQLFLKNRSQLQELIQTEFNPGKPLRLDYRNQTFNIKPSDIGASPNTLMTENRLLEEGRKGNILERILDRKSTRLNSSHQIISYAVFCLKKKKKYATRFASGRGTSAAKPARCTAMPRPGEICPSSSWRRLALCPSCVSVPDERRAA